VIISVPPTRSVNARALSSFVVSFHSRIILSLPRDITQFSSINVPVPVFLQSRISLSHDATRRISRDAPLRINPRNQSRPSEFRRSEGDGGQTHLLDRRETEEESGTDLVFLHPVISANGMSVRQDESGDVRREVKVQIGPSSPAEYTRLPFSSPFANPLLFISPEPSRESTRIPSPFRLSLLRRSISSG